MKRMEEMILAKGKVLPGGVLKVGSFLNQQIDTDLLREIGDEVARLYAGAGVTKVLTVEASGISMATAVGMALRVPVVFAKKHKTSNVDGEVYQARVHSFTHNIDYDMLVSRDYLLAEDRVLIVDDFLAVGAALTGMRELVEQAGAECVGAAIAIEKSFQGSSDKMRAEGFRIESMAVIESMDENGIRFRE